MNGDEDSVLVREFKAGNEKAFDRVFDKYQLSIYSICYRFTRNDADAREVTQDIFIKVYRNLCKFNERSKLFTWMYRIAVNTCISFTRTRKRHNRWSRYTEYEPPDQTLPMDMRIAMKKSIDDALMQVPERQRMCFILHHYEGYTFAEVASIMGITTGAAKANYHHAIRKLRAALEQWL
jgi:RNA polymerase sigma-70 factor (ECF subfamily)